MVEFLVLEKKNDYASSGLPFQVFETWEGDGGNLPAL